MAHPRYATSVAFRFRCRPAPPCATEIADALVGPGAAPRIADASSAAVAAPVRRVPPGASVRSCPWPDVSCGTRGFARLSSGARLLVGALLTGWPLLVLSAAPFAWAVLLVVLVHTFGEMIWTPTATALAAGAAPEGRRGQYLGAYGAAVSVAFALGPFSGLELLAATSSTRTWLCFAVVAAGAAAASARLAGPLSRRTAVAVDVSCGRCRTSRRPRRACVAAGRCSAPTDAPAAPSSSARECAQTSPRSARR
jgi:hypothetical protein